MQCSSELNTKNKYIIMETINLQITQSVNGLTNEFTQIFDVTNDNFNVIIGTALNRLFEYQSTLKSINDKGAFKCNAPLKIVIETPTEIISTEDIAEHLQEGLKIGNTAKGKKRFANKVYRLLEFALSNVREISYNELIAEIEAELSK